MTILRLAIILIFPFFIPFLCSGQGGVHVQAGLISGKNNLEAVTPGGQAHGGFRIGLDARLGDDSMYFLPGIHYQKMSFFPENSIKFFGNDPTFQIIKARFGLGFNLFRFSSKNKLRGKILGSISFLSNFPENIPPVGDNSYNTGIGGIDLGIGFDFSFLSVDLEYEKGVVNAVNEIKDSYFNFWSLSFGVFF